MSVDTEKIKISLYYRAKYRISKTIVYPPLVVPHPRCCGEAVTSVRTKQLTATIINKYDTIEANNNAVAVEDNPRWRGHAQQEFAKTVKPDPDVAEQDSGVVATWVVYHTAI